MPVRLAPGRVKSHISPVPIIPPVGADPGELFGPRPLGGIAGAAAVRAGAGHRTVSNPGGAAISFTSPSDLATKIAANPNGSTFVAAGSMTWATQVNTGQTKAPKIYIPTPFVMNGNGNTAVGLIMMSGEVHGGEWINWGGEQAPVTANGTAPNGTGPHKEIWDINSHNNFGKAFNNGSTDVLISHCTAHTNGRYGFGSVQSAAGSNSFNRPPAVFEYINCYNNNTRGLAHDSDAGGTKILHTCGIEFRNCWFHDNAGSGLWFDYNQGYVAGEPITPNIVEDNVFENNGSWGFFYEMGTAYASEPFVAALEARYNYSKDNCTLVPSLSNWFVGEMLVSCSDGLKSGGTGYDLHHNIIDSVHHSGFVDHPFHPLPVRGCRFHDNDVWIRPGNTSPRMGGSWEVGAPAPGTDPFAAAQANTFENNHYHVPAGTLGTSWFRWGNGSGLPGGHVNQTFAQWQAAGRDNTGTMVTI